MNTNELTIPTDFADCYFVLHSAKDEEGYADSLFARALLGYRRKKNNTESFDFYGIRASKYGTRIPPSATGWALVHSLNGELNTLASGDIPEPVTKSKVQLSDGRMVTVRRSQVNLFFAVSALPVTPRKTPKPQFDLNSIFNDPFKP